jgi:hypothetical protein
MLNVIILHYWPAAVAVGLPLVLFAKSWFKNFWFLAYFFATLFLVLMISVTNFEPDGYSKESRYLGIKYLLYFLFCGMVPTIMLTFFYTRRKQFSVPNLYVVLFWFLSIFAMVIRSFLLIWTCTTDGK